MDDQTRVTARVILTAKMGEDPVQLSFQPDYAHGRNAQWASATPALSLSMTVKREVADLFEAGEAIELTLSRNVDQPVTSDDEPYRA